MCVLALAWDAHPQWRLVVAGNRDERHDRPARPLQRWDEAGGVLAGQDLQSGGTWMGVSEEGRFAVVTNLRGFGAPEAGRPSRGLLLSDLLAGQGRYAAASEADLADFNPLNLITVQAGHAEAWSNQPAQRRRLAPGIYGLSNGALDAPWPKTLRLKAILAQWLVAGADRPEALLDSLGEDALPAADGVPSDAPQDASMTPIFIRDPVYGTRCSTVVAIDRVGHGLIVERRFDARGEPIGQTALPFAWPAESGLKDAV